MGQERRRVYYDRDLKLEAYQLSGVVQKFPNHFHDYYVIGFVEGGRRRLWCRGLEYGLGPGDLVLFNPRDNHYCAPVDGEALDYRAVNVDPEVMARAAEEVTGRAGPPRFTQNVVPQSEIAPSLAGLYRAVVERAPRFEKEEAFYYLLEQVLCQYSEPWDGADLPRSGQRVRELCAYMEDHYAENLSLDALCVRAGWGKSYLLRIFARQVGVSPYRYLQTVRLDRAKRLLEQGEPPADAALLAGFSDQSHFTNFFKEFTGLTPKQYQRIFTEAGEEARHEGI